MGLTYRVPQSVIDAVLVSMKAARLIHSEAVFNACTADGTRKEVEYRDLDFLQTLADKDYEEIIVDSALSYLKERGLLDRLTNYDKRSFLEFREYIGIRLTWRDWTSMTPVMERMFYMLTSVRKPDSMIELGCFWGNTLAWFAGPCLGPAPQFKPRRIYAVDIDAHGIQMAKANFSNIARPSCLEIACEDARDTLKRLDVPFDFVYLDAHLPRGEDLSLPLLTQLYDKMPKGAWVMAHDTTFPPRRNRVRDYLSFVRDRQHFSESITFDVDPWGLESQ